MFGYPSYYVGGKLFACIYENGLGLKVPESMAEELVIGIILTISNHLAERR
jgi:TfoX/Sxy family transcriptional regulator of competence genes